MKKLLYALLGLIIGASAFTATAQVRVLIPSQGGTGIGSAVAGDVGKCLTVSDNSPFTYALDTCGVGGSSQWTDGGSFDYNLEEVNVGTSTEIANRPLFSVGTSTELFSVASTTGNVTVARTLLANTLTLTTPLAATSGGTGLSALGTGVATWLGTPSSANLASAVTGETGSGALVFATSPALVTPDLGIPSAVTLTNGTGLPIATGVSGLGAGVADFLGTPSSANLATAVTGETGSGGLVFATSPTFVTPTLGVAAATSIDTGHGANEVYVVGDGLEVSTNDLIFDCSDVVSTGLQCSGEDLQLNATGDWTGTVDGNNFAGGAIGAGELLYGASAGSITELSIGASSTVLTTAGTTPKWQSFFAAMISDLAAGVATWLVTPSSANLDTVVTDDTGSGALVFGTSPTFTTSALSPVFSSTAADPADAGVLRLGNAEVVGWEASPAGTDVTLTVNTSEVLVLAGGGLTATAGTATFGTLAGALDAGGATSFEIPNGTGPTVDTLGEIGFDTTDNQVLIATGTTPAVIPTTQKLWGATIASTSVDFVSGGRIPLPPLRDGASITEIHCFVDGGTSVVINIDVLANGSPTDTLACTATLASDTAQSVNFLKTAGALNVVEIGTITGTVDYVTFSVWGTWTRE